MNDHAPILAVLSAGPLRIQNAGTEHVFVCKTGTFSLSHGQATILVERPFNIDDIDVAAIRKQLAPPAEGAAADRVDSEEVAYLELLCQVKERYA